MALKKVLLDTHFRKIETIFTPEDFARLNGACEIIWGKDDPIPAAELEAVQEEIQIIITGRWRHGDVARYPKLEAIIEVAGGFPSMEDLDYEACFARSIRILSVAPAFGPAVAEMGLALALACSRQVAWIDQAFRHGEPTWDHLDFTTETGTPFTMYGKQIGFIGFGGLARALKPLLEPFNAPIQVYDPWLTDAYLETQGVTPVDLDTLLKTSRFIFVLAVVSASNKAFLDHRELSLIREDAVFLLLSRAHVVDFDVLTTMLAEGRFRAGIDVFPEEPLPADHPIRQVKHAVLSSHRAGAIGEGLHNVGRLVARDVEAMCQGLVPQELQVAQPEFIRLRGR